MRYADQLALAFQIMDDVRDVEGGPALGKDAGGDLDRRVPTWPLIERLAMRPGSREMWLSEQTSSAELQTDLVHRGATKVARPALMAVGADYNLLLAMRIREEARAGLGTGIIRAFAGIVFGITVFALTASTVLSVAQIGVTVGVACLSTRSSCVASSCRRLSRCWAAGSGGRPG